MRRRIKEITAHQYKSLLFHTKLLSASNFMFYLCIYLKYSSYSTTTPLRCFDSSISSSLSSSRVSTTFILSVVSSQRDSDPGPPPSRRVFKSTEPTTMLIMKSEIEVLLSQVSSNLTDIHVKMSNAEQQQKDECLAAVEKILQQLGCLVRTKLSSSCDVSNKSSFYNLYYDDEESVHSNFSEEEESVHSNSKDEKEVFITEMVSFIKSSAPSYIYDARRMKAKRRRKMKKRVHPELRNLWDNASTILSPIPVNNAKQSATLYPRVDWKCVNKRFLSNIPLPSSLPLHGCSPNPDDYKDEFYQNDYGGMQNLGSKFDREFPFGTALGFLTDAGPINVPDEIFHGHSYQPGQGWLLHAEYPEKVKERMKRRQRG